MGRGNTKIEDFFLAGRQMRWWAAGLSVMATQISAITFVGTTGQAYTKGMSFLVFYFGLPFAMVILCATLVPFFYRAGVFTAYQYLEKRFDSRTRTLTSLLFLLSRGLAVGVTLYAPSVVLSVILGWSETASILPMGGSTIAYLVYGGNKSVMWTDVVQMAIIWFGIFVCVGAAIANLPEGFGVRDSLAVASLTGHLDIMDTSWDLRKPYTLWSGLIGGLFLSLAYFRCGQSQAQRYPSGRSLTESRLAPLFRAVPKRPTHFPSYVVSQLSGGLAGLVIAVIFAAAMSTLSGELNSLATASMVDFYLRFVKTSATNAHYLAVSRVFTVFWGGFACVVALQAGHLGPAIEVVNRFGSFFYGSILGVFGLAVLTPRAPAPGAFYGLLARMVTVFLLARYTSLSFLWYNVVGAVTVFAIGLLLTGLGHRH